MAKSFEELEQEEILREQYKEQMLSLKRVVDTVKVIKSGVHNDITAAFQTAIELGDTEKMLEVFNTSNQISFDKPTGDMRESLIKMFEKGRHEHGAFTLNINESITNSIDLKRLKENDPFLYDALVKDYMRETKKQTVSVRKDRR